MSGRVRGPPPPPMKGVPHNGPPFVRGHGPVPHPAALFDEMREPHFAIMGPPRHHPAMIIEERLAGQHQEVQALLADNQRLAATHVALKQELEVSQHELQRVSRYGESVRAEKDAQLRELCEKSMRLEEDLHAAEATRAELYRVNVDIKELNAARQDLTGKVQMMTQDLARINAELQQAPALRAEIEAVKQELQRARAAIEYEKKGYAENYEHGQVMESKLITMARELEKLRGDVELVNAEKRARAALSVVTVNQGYPANNAGYPANNAGYPGNGANYPVNYGNPDGAAGYGSHYPVNYGMNPVQSGPEGFPPYGAAPGSWGAYDMQRAQGHMN